MIFGKLLLFLGVFEGFNHMKQKHFQKEENHEAVCEISPLQDVEEVRLEMI